MPKFLLTIVAGAFFVTAIQTVVSHRLDPFEMGVVTIGAFDGKGQFNVIKDSIALKGDVPQNLLPTVILQLINDKDPGKNQLVVRGKCVSGYISI